MSTGVSHTLDLSGGAPELLRLAAAAAEAARRAGGRHPHSLTSRGEAAPPVPAAPPAPAETSGTALAARYQRLVLLNRMSLELFADKPAEDALSDSFSTILALTGAKYAALYFCDELGAPALALRRGEGPWTKEEALPREAALVVRALKERSILTPEDGPEAWAAAPLLSASPSGPSALGVLVVGLLEPRPRDPELEQTMLEISRLLRNARLMRKHTEQQEVLAAVTEQSADAISITDRGHRIVSWNSSAEALLGYPSAEVLGRNVDFLIPKDRLSELGEREARALAEGRAQTFETVRLRKNGELVPVEATFFPLRDDRGQAIGMVRVFRDITKRKEVERMKSEFVSMVSHELRTPLTAIQGFAETIFDFWDELKPEQRRHYLTIILSEAERLGRLVTNFLDISRLEAGGVRLKPAPVDLADLARRAATLFKEHPSKAAVLVEFAPGSEKAWADEEQLYRVFVNLLSNALKYSPEGGRVTVRGSGAGPEAEVSVEDQGPGMPPQAQERLFQKFYRAGDPVSRKTPGTGLGLAICRNILAAHGGRIWAESAPGKGSAFKFSFPREGLKPS
jgi:PAS domain S-box-containing protein